MSRAGALVSRLFAPLARSGRSFLRDERGVTMIEFGILSLPFFTIVTAILQTGILFLAMQVLDSSVEDASRMIRTGRAQQASYNLANFRTYMCGYTFNLFDCSQIKIEVKKIATFTSATTAPAVQTCDTATCTWSVVEAYTPGVGRDVIQVSAYYRFPLIVVLPWFNLKNQPDNYRLISGIRVFRNEPF